MARPLDYSEWRRILKDLPLPAAILDRDAFDRNVALFAGLVQENGSGQSLRLATKSIRVPELMRRILSFGPPYRGLMTYTVRETAFLAEIGFDDFLVAYPTCQPDEWRLARRIHEDGKTIRLMVDSIEAARGLSRVMAGASRPLPVTLDVDMSLRYLGGRAHLGVRRSPIRSVRQVCDFFDAARELTGIEPVGLMGYEAQLAGLPDRNPFEPWMNGIKRLVRRASVTAVRDLRERIALELKARGHVLQIFNGGGTGSANLSPREPWLTEVTVGSGFVCSHLFSYFRNVAPEPALFFALATVRSSDPGWVTCQGGGYVASGPPGWDKIPIPYLPDGVHLLPGEACGEVQTPLRLEPDCALTVGEPVLFRHAKAGELAEHFREYLLVSGGEIVGRAPTYRGLEQCFL